MSLTLKKNSRGLSFTTHLDLDKTLLRLWSLMSPTSSLSHILSISWICYGQWNPLSLLFLIESSLYISEPEPAWPPGPEWAGLHRGPELEVPEPHRQEDAQRRLRDQHRHLDRGQQRRGGLAGLRDVCDQRGEEHGGQPRHRLWCDMNMVQWWLSYLTS